MMEGTIEYRNPKTADYRLHEYDKLRDEVVKRIELQQNVLLLTFIIFGGFIAAAMPSTSSEVSKELRAHMLLLYPLLASVLTNVWVRHHMMILEIARHVISIEHEAHFRGWENRPLCTWIHIIGDLPIFAIILFSQTAMIFVGLYWLDVTTIPRLAAVATLGWPGTYLIVLDLLAIAWTAGLTFFTLGRDRVMMSVSAPWRSAEYFGDGSDDDLRLARDRS